MSERMYVTVLLSGCAVLLAVLVWVVVAFTGAPRSAHEPAVETASLERLSAQLDDLSRRIGAAPALGAGGGAVARPAPGQPAPGEILVAWTDEPRPFDDPLDSGWDRAPETVVALQRQDQAMPVLDEATVTGIRVRGLTDGRHIGWRLAWDDAVADYHLDTDRFCDAVAIQLPLEANAAYTMGDRDFPVQLIQWKAIWQKDVDEHFQDVQDLHPNYWADLYWFADGEFPYRVPDDFTRTEALDWFVAYRAGNPMADMFRRLAAQEMIAEGFGTSTTQAESVSVARGVWNDGEWTVVIARPMATTDDADYQFAPGRRDVIGFAVWEGSVENVGARKQHSQWTVFEIQP